MRENQCADADIHLLANGVSEHKKKRLQIVYDGSTDSYQVGCYNGHSLPVTPCGGRKLINRPTHFVHGADWASATSILRHGLKSPGRQDIHLVRLHMNARQEAYIRPDGRKPHRLVVGGAIASADGITFYKLENDVIASQGLQGSIPPFPITSIWENTRTGRF